jgi:hypothetical protein
MLGAMALLTIGLAGMGCDRTVVRAKPTAVCVTNNVGPEPVIFDTPEVTEERELCLQASKHLYAREFDSLDRMADHFRSTKAEYASGIWKVGVIYQGCSELPKEASETRWTNMIAHLRLWVEAKPESITARTALGRALASYAWKARGGGWANTVSQSGWKVFHARLAESRKVFLSATNLPVTCPLWFTGFLGVGLGESWPREVYDRVFAIGTNYFREYARIYYVKCHYLLPRWHGGEGEWEQFAADAADQLGGEEGDILYARIIWEMHKDRWYGNIFKQSNASWSRAKRGFLALEKRYPDSLALTSEFCYLAGMGGDRALMKALFAKLEGRVDLSVWYERQRFVQDRQWAFGK